MICQWLFDVLAVTIHFLPSLWVALVTNAGRTYFLAFANKLDFTRSTTYNAHANTKLSILNKNTIWTFIGVTVNYHSVSNFFRYKVKKEQNIAEHETVSFGAGEI